MILLGFFFPHQRQFSVFRHHELIASCVIRRVRDTPGKPTGWWVGECKERARRSEECPSGRVHVLSDQRSWNPDGGFSYWEEAVLEVVTPPCKYLREESVTSIPPALMWYVSLWGSGSFTLSRILSLFSRIRHAAEMQRCDNRWNCSSAVSGCVWLTGWWTECQRQITSRTLRQKKKTQVPFLKSVSVPGRNQRPGSASSFNSLKRSFSAGLASELCSPAVRRSMWDSGGLAWPEQTRDGDCRKLVGSDAAERTNQTVEKWEEAPGRPEAQDGAVSLAHPTGCGSLLALLLLLYTPFSLREWMNATIHTIFFKQC